MEALDRARRPIRADLKQLLEEIGKLLSDPVDKDAVRVHYKMIQDAYEKLREKDEQVADLLVEQGASEEKQDEEYSRVREIKLKVETLRIKIDNLLNLNPVSSGGSVHNGSIMGDGEPIGLNLPKYEFKKFGGDLMEWLGFWAQFRKIDQHPKLDGSDKFGYLLMALEPGSEAYETVSVFPQSNENYSEAVKALKRNFGDEDTLLQVYLRELLKLVISTANSKEKLHYLYCLEKWIHT